MPANLTAEQRDRALAAWQRSLRCHWCDCPQFHVTATQCRACGRNIQ